VIVDAYRVGGRCDLEQGTVDVEKQAPGSAFGTCFGRQNRNDRFNDGRQDYLRTLMFGSNTIV